MQTRRALDVVFLTVLVILLGYLAKTGGLLPRLGAVPVALDGPFLKEEAWIVDEIVRDITEMSASPSKGTAALSIHPRDGVYDIARGADGAAPVSVVKDFRDVLVDLNRRGVTVVMNSHLLSEVELVATRVAILARGRLVAVDELDALKRGSDAAPRSLEETFISLVGKGDARA